MKVVDEILKKLKHPLRSKSRKPTKAHLRTGELGTALTMTASAKIERHQEILDEAYAAGWDSAMAKSKINVSESHAPDSLRSPLCGGDESPEDEEMNITGLPKGLTGDYTDEYGPTSQFAVSGSVGAHDVGVTANDRPAYEEDAAVVEGQGYFFKPKEAHVGQVPGRNNDTENAFPQITTASPPREAPKRSTTSTTAKSTSDDDPAISLDPKEEHEANKSLFNKGGVHAAMEEILRDPNTQMVHPDEALATSGKSVKTEGKSRTEFNPPHAKDTDKLSDKVAPNSDLGENGTPNPGTPEEDLSQIGTPVNINEKEHEIDTEIALTQAQIDKLKLEACMNTGLASTIEK